MLQDNYSGSVLAAEFEPRVVGSGVSGIIGSLTIPVVRAFTDGVHACVSGKTVPVVSGFVWDSAEAVMNIQWRYVAAFLSSSTHKQRHNLNGLRIHASRHLSGHV